RGQPRLQQHPVQVQAVDRRLALGAARVTAAARFSPEEMARRHASARALMHELDLEALVLFGNSGVNRHNNVNPFWLSQYLDMHHCYLVVPRAEDLDPALFVGLANHVPNAREISDVPVVEWGGYEAGDIVAARLAEHELVAIAEDAYRRRGGAVRITFLRSMPMDAPNGCLPAQNPSARRLERGDVIVTEISASLEGYSGQIHRPVFVGAEPTADWQRLFDVAKEAYDRVAITPDERMGLQLGALTVVTDDGAECLHGLPFEPLLAA